LSAFPLPELLQVLCFQSKDVLVVVRSGQRTVRVTMRGGQVDFVQSFGLGPLFRIGRFLVAEGAISAARIEAFVGSGALKGRPIGRALLSAGLITAGDLSKAVVRQTTELVYELLRWPDGQAVVSHGAHASDLEAETKLRLTLEMLLTEGLRRVSHWSQLEAELPPMEAALEPNLLVINGFKLSTLVELETELLETARGGRSLREMIDTSTHRPYEVCRAVHVLTGAHLLRVKPL